MLPEAVKFENVDGAFVNPEPSPTKALAVIVPLALIPPEAVIFPLNVCVSVDASPNIFEPLEKSIEDDTIDDVIWVTFNLSAVIKPETFNPPVIWVFK